MHPILADSRRLLAYLAACVIAGLGLAVLLRLGGQAEWAGALLFAVPLGVAFGFIALSAYYVCRALPPHERDVQAVATQFGAATLVAALAWLGAAEAWNAVGTAWTPPQPLVRMPLTGWMLFFSAGAVLYLVSLLAHDALAAFERMREAGRREASLKLLAREAELRLLRTQVGPHFLFNCLNSISALTSADPAAAREMAIDLAQFFRRTLAQAGRERIALADEVALTRQFLAIEQRRFGERLRAALRIASEAEACLVPAMTLQPLVENAIKHGRHALGPDAAIEVDALVRDGWLHLSVTSPVDGERPTAASLHRAGAEAPSARSAADNGLGLGLANIRSRLALMHGGRARLQARQEADRFVVTITLPAQVQAPLPASVQVPPAVQPAPEAPG